MRHITATYFPLNVLVEVRCGVISLNGGYRAEVVSQADNEKETAIFTCVLCILCLLLFILLLLVFIQKKGPSLTPGAP